MLSYRVPFVVNFSVEDVVLLLEELGAHLLCHVHEDRLAAEPALSLEFLGLLVEWFESFLIYGLKLVIRVEVTNAPLFVRQ